MSPESVSISCAALELRPPRFDDADAFCTAAKESVELVGRWLPWCHEKYHRDDSIAWIDASREAWTADDYYPLVIVDRQDGALLGGVGINEIDRLRRRANLGYWVRSSRMRHGVATRAARLAAEWGFRALGLQRIEIVAATGNYASQRVATQLGALCEGIARNRLRVRDVPTDAWIYSLVPSDLQQWLTPC